MQIAREEIFVAFLHELCCLCDKLIFTEGHVCKLQGRDFVACFIGTRLLCDNLILLCAHLTIRVV